MNGSLADNHAGCYHTAHCGLCLVAESCILSLHAEEGREARMMRPKSCAGYQDLRTEHVVESSREELIFWIPFDVFKLILRDELPHHHTGPVQGTEGTTPGMAACRPTLGASLIGLTK